MLCVNKLRRFLIIDTNKFYTFNSYLKEFDLTPSEEDYIEMIYRISLNNDGVARVKQISGNLNVTPPSASRMINKLTNKNLLINKKYGYITLSDVGNTIGKKLLYRHNTIETFLLTIGVKDNILENTEKLEHVINEEILTCIDALLLKLNVEKKNDK